ncbi:MAG: AMMECR1 domain-containing protein [Arcobacter sp.]|nr:MAG: AMMECR1 domain-containing protein [Arcobacter sp.]
MKEVLLSLARACIKSHFTQGHLDNSNILEEYPFLKDKGACFITLTFNGELRGCIGSTTAYRSLLEDVMENAKAAAFRDPRFVPLNEDELKSIRIEVSLLSEPKVLQYTDFDDLKTKIRIGEDGVILKLGNNQSTFLPQVWEMLQSHELFFSHLYQKAGLEPECIKQRPQIQTYQVEKVIEN